jgi:regulation of enolase protein 1 (concanavalin A-like superfamily)
MLMIIARNYRTVYKSTATTRGLRTSTETVAALVENNKTDCIAEAFEADEGRTLENHIYYIPQKDMVSSVTSCGCSDEWYLHNGHAHAHTHTLQLARKSNCCRLNYTIHLQQTLRNLCLQSHRL